LVDPSKLNFILHKKGINAWKILWLQHVFNHMLNQENAWKANWAHI
jgi:hypothetical protein